VQLHCVYDVFQAYKDWALTNNELQLPNKNMTIEQFFFIAFAQVILLLNRPLVIIVLLTITVR